MRPAAIALVLLATGVAPIAAQDSLSLTPRSRGLAWAGVHYGKWLSAASAVGFTILAAHEHDRANKSWQQLLDLCRSDNSLCQLRADGRYTAYQAELLFQETIFYDRRARNRLIVGQLSMLTSAALFILDLRHGTGRAPNIPFHGLELTAEPAGDGAWLGVRVPF